MSKSAVNSQAWGEAQVQLLGRGQTCPCPGVRCIAFATSTKTPLARGLDPFFQLLPNQEYPSSTGNRHLLKSVLAYLQGKAHP